jgi:hypothetical protein
MIARIRLERKYAGARPIQSSAKGKKLASMACAAKDLFKEAYRLS